MLTEKPVRLAGTVRMVGDGLAGIKPVAFHPSGTGARSRTIHAFPRKPPTGPLYFSGYTMKLPGFRIHLAEQPGRDGNPGP